jgi:hypothetical protein
VKKFLVCAAFVALAACGSQQPQPTPTATPTPTPTATTPKLPAPDKDTFAAAFAAACPHAQKVSTALCQSAGFGKQGFVCNYGLGDDKYRRNTANLAPGDGKWVLADPKKDCPTG